MRWWFKKLNAMQLVHCCSLAAGAVTLEYESFEFTDDLLTGPNCVYTAGSNTRQLQTDTSPSSIWREKKEDNAKTTIQCYDIKFFAGIVRVILVGGIGPQHPRQ